MFRLSFLLVLLGFQTSVLRLELILTTLKHLNRLLQRVNIGFQVVLRAGLLSQGFNLLGHLLLLEDLVRSLFTLSQLPKLAQVIDIVRTDLVVGEEHLLQSRLGKDESEEIEESVPVLLQETPGLVHFKKLLLDFVQLLVTVFHSLDQLFRVHLCISLLGHLCFRI